jgi:hypothetical protein
MAQVDYELVSTAIAGGAAVFLGACGLSAVLGEVGKPHFGSRGTASGGFSSEAVREVMRELDPVDSLYFDLSVARHALEEHDTARAKRWLDPYHAMGELNRSARMGFISPSDATELTRKIEEVVRLIDEGKVSEAHARLVELQTKAGEIVYSAIAQRFKEKGFDPPEYMDARFEPLREKKRAEWTAKGYPPGLIEKALRWAEDWARGIATRFVKPPELAATVAESIYPEALELSEEWIKAFVGS